jgi:IS30 family transposase
MREREIANLVAADLSNKEFADRLVVSVRTVEGHLYRASIKHSRYRDGISEFGQRGGERCCCSSERQLSARRCHFCTSAAAVVVAFGFRKIRNDPPVGVANRSSTHDSLV